VAGIMRKQIMSIAAENRILTFENPVTAYALMNAEEVFVTNSIHGVQWVGQFKDKFFTNKMSQFFIEKLQSLTA
jgi:branched-chain amino acid aminotransferase